MATTRVFQAGATTGYDHTAVLTLALDTTTKGGSVALVRGETVLAVIQGDDTRTHGERLPGEIDRALAAARVAPGDLELIAVATGPGAFTGLRIGLAAVQGLAIVTATPVVGVSALDALGRAAFEMSSTDGPVSAWMDAARGEVFAACYGRDQRGSPTPVPTDCPLVAKPAIILSTLAAMDVSTTTFIGDGAVRYRVEIARGGGGDVCVLEPPPALAPIIALIGQQLAGRGQAGPPHGLQPLYVRRPDAELERARGRDSAAGSAVSWTPSRPAVPRADSE